MTSGPETGSVHGRACEVCTFDESVTSFEDIDQFVFDPLPSDFGPATRCTNCSGVYGPDDAYDRERTAIYAARLARI
ncbi:hypothetical protein [Cryobacterium zongtaii]|uniref:hypothetical protein n=1 Tax=Cryobacterium zongtaii TaxID=1259217 RepID=UPI00105739CF|nr:hypothetical protein [Cryobacterium zongtaii]